MSVATDRCASQLDGLTILGWFGEQPSVFNGAQATDEACQPLNVNVETGGSRHTRLHLIQVASEFRPSNRITIQSIVNTLQFTFAFAA